MCRESRAAGVGAEAFAFIVANAEMMHDAGLSGADALARALQGGADGGSLAAGSDEETEGARKRYKKAKRMSLQRAAALAERTDRRWTDEEGSP
jgi:hypothetical protein